MPINENAIPHPPKKNLFHPRLPGAGALRTKSNNPNPVVAVALLWTPKVTSCVYKERRTRPPTNHDVRAGPNSPLGPVLCRLAYRPTIGNQARTENSSPSIVDQRSARRGSSSACLTTKAKKGLWSQFEITISGNCVARSKPQTSARRKAAAASWAAYAERRVSKLFFCFATKTRKNSPRSMLRSPPET